MSECGCDCEAIEKELSDRTKECDALAQGLSELIFSIESTHHDDNAMAQPLDLAKACLKENGGGE